MSNSRNLGTGFMKFAMQSDAPGGGGAKRVGSSAGALDLGRPRGENLRQATGFGVTHYVQAALSILVAVFVAWLAHSAWDTFNLPNHGAPAGDDSFGAGLGAAMDYWMAVAFPGISCLIFLFGGFSFLVGNRLIRHRSLRFCRAFAIFECFVGIALIVAGSLTWFLASIGAIDPGAGLLIALGCFLIFPLTVIPGVIGIFTLRMLKRQGGSFAWSAPGRN